MELPCDLDEAQEVTAQGAPISTLVGKWDLEVHTNKITFVAAIRIPFHDPANAVEGSKQGREALLKQLRDDNGGCTSLGLGYRDKYEKDSKLPDPYFKGCL